MFMSMENQRSPPKNHKPCIPDPYYQQQPIHASGDQVPLEFFLPSSVRSPLYIYNIGPRLKYPSPSPPKSQYYTLDRGGINFLLFFIRRR
jgi:hypothetical protein